VETGSAPWSSLRRGWGKGAAAWEDARDHTVLPEQQKIKVIVGETLGLVRKPVCQTGT